MFHRAGAPTALCIGVRMTSERDLEKARFEAAIKAFSDAFEMGYAEGKRLLAAGDLTRPIMAFPFPIDVPCAAFRSNQWAEHVPRFEEAGLDAALSLLRVGEVHLDDSRAREDAARPLHESCRWHVVERR
jgi:hypothetical protein